MYKCTNGQHALSEFRLVKEERSAGGRGRSIVKRGKGSKKRVGWGRGKRGLRQEGPQTGSLQKLFLTINFLTSWLFMHF